MERQAIAELAARRARPARLGWVRRRGRSGLSELLVERVERRELVGKRRPRSLPLRAMPGLHVAQNGAWLLSDLTPLVPELEAFLAAGEPPVYVGFGSIPMAAATRSASPTSTRTGSRPWASPSR